MSLLNFKEECRVCNIAGSTTFFFMLRGSTDQPAEGPADKIFIIATTIFQKTKVLIFIFPRNLMGRITGSQDIMKRKADKPQPAGTVLTSLNSHFRNLASLHFFSQQRRSAHSQRAKLDSSNSKKMLRLL